MQNIHLNKHLQVIINLYFIFFFKLFNKFIDEYCCAGAYSTSETCQNGPDPTMKYTDVIHQYCPGVYAWAYDDGTGLYNCPSTETLFTLTFYCP